MCGAAASSDASRCEHCGARLATVSCPQCFALQFQGARFCSQCGARLEREESDDAKGRRCPRCTQALQPVILGKTQLDECPKCEGLWLDRASLDQICSDREQQSIVLGNPLLGPPPSSVNIEERIRYLPCPVCRNLMNRVNFASCSHVIVDVCRAHGTWFDKDELRRVVEFIRAGGLDAARAREIEELKARRRELDAARAAGGSMNPPCDAWSRNDAHLGASLVSAALRGLFGL